MDDSLPRQRPGRGVAACGVTHVLSIHICVILSGRWSLIEAPCQEGHPSGAVGEIAGSRGVALCAWCAWCAVCAWCAWCEVCAVCAWCVQ